VIFHFTAEDIERANRIMSDPFDSDEVRLFVYGEPVASDDGLFKHRGEYVPCFGCQPDPFTGEATWRHAHLVVEGMNGGVRCEPLRITAIAQDYLSRWGADALELLVESGLLFPDDDED
jgi:hypothetical protein